MINRIMMYPAFFTGSTQTWKSNLYLDTKAINLIDIMEIIVGIFYLKCIVNIKGKPASLRQLTHGFETLFNFKFSDIYKKEEAVIQRRLDKLTGFLSRMKDLIVKRSKEKGYNL